MSRLTDELRRKYRSPREAIRALGIDEAVLADPEPPETISAAEALSAISEILNSVAESEFPALADGLTSFLESIPGNGAAPEGALDMPAIRAEPLTGRIFEPSSTATRRPAMDSRSAFERLGVRTADTGDDFRTPERPRISMDSRSRKTREVNRAEQARRSSDLRSRFPMLQNS
jgi:hypothetical protein